MNEYWSKECVVGFEVDWLIINLVSGTSISEYEKETERVVLLHQVNYRALKKQICKIRN